MCVSIILATRSRPKRWPRFAGATTHRCWCNGRTSLNALTLTLARVLGPEIRVNAVAPGMVDSPWLKNGLGAERFAAMLKNYQSSAALAALVTPEEVAETIYYLGAIASKTTGEVHVVDGGRCVGRN